MELSEVVKRAILMGEADPFLDRSTGIPSLVFDEMQFKILEISGDTVTVVAEILHKGVVVGRFQPRRLIAQDVMAVRGIDARSRVTIA